MKIFSSKCIPFLVIVCSPFFLYSQFDFRSGYIIKNSNDTLVGELDYQSDKAMSATCTFKNSNGTVGVYAPNDLIGYRFKEGRHFVSKEVDSTMKFLEYLVEGRVNIYYMRDEVSDHYFIDKEGMPLSEIKYEKGTRLQNGMVMEYESTSHIGLLNYYMSDAPGFFPKIEAIKKPERKNLIALAKAYHAAVCPNCESIDYEYQVPKFKVIPELITEAIKYPDLEDLSNRFHAQVGLIGHIALPSINKNFYFRTGALYSKLDFRGGPQNRFKVPFQLEYMHGRGLIKPRLAYGMNFYLPFYQTVSWNLGTNITINNKLSISLTTDLESTPKAFILPDEFFSYSVLLGLIYTY